VAATVILPSDAIVVDDMRRLDDAFITRVTDRLRERLGAGTALVVASRDAPMVEELCHEVILLRDGTIADRGDPAQWAARRATARDGERTKAARSAPAPAPEPTVAEPEAPPRPREVAAFNASAALIAAEVQTAERLRTKRFHAHEELRVEIRLETAVSAVEVRCGISFMPRSGATGFRLELPQPLGVPRPQAQVLVARIFPATLPSGGYEVRADATVTVASAPAGLIARGAGRIRIEDEGIDFPTPADPPVEGWDGSAAWPVEAEWFVDEERRRR
jgi:hypothetical protein